MCVAVPDGIGQGTRDLPGCRFGRMRILRSFSAATSSASALAFLPTAEFHLWLDNFRRSLTTDSARTRSPFFNLDSAPGFPTWLHSQHDSLAITTSQTVRQFLVGTAAPPTPDIIRTFFQKTRLPRRDDQSLGMNSFHPMRRFDSRNHPARRFSTTRSRFAWQPSRPVPVVDARKGIAETRFRRVRWRQDL